MKTHIRQWGNSLAVRIPKAFAVEAGLQAHTEVELTMRDGQLILTPVTQSGSTLEQLVAGITDENRHPEFDFGADVGKEVWE